MPLSANYSARVPLVSGVKSAEEINELIRLIEVIAKDDFFVKEIINRVLRPPGAWEAPGSAQNNLMKLHFWSEVNW